VSEQREDERRRRREFVDDLERQTEHARRLLDEIEERRREAEHQRLNFTAPTTEQLRKKLASAESPMIVGQSWGNATPDGTINYTVWINNPDPVQWFWLFVHVFVGPVNVTPDVGGVVSAADERFPRLTMPRFAGLTLGSGATQSLSFSLAVPAGIQRSNYLGNAILFQPDWHDVGKYLDRGGFVFEVT
jgi:hypothetical protein